LCSIVLCIFIQLREVSAGLFIIHENSK